MKNSYLKNAEINYKFYMKSKGTKIGRMIYCYLLIKLLGMN